MVTVQQTGGLAVITPSDFEMYRTIAAWASKSQLVPDHFKGKPEDSLIAMLIGREMGVPPMIALQKGFVIKGKFDMEVKVKIGVAQERVPDFDFEIVELSEVKCTVKGGRKGKNQQTVTYTMEDAKRAGLLEEKDSKFGKPYKEHPGFFSNPKDQLMWRAVGRLLNLTCAGALFNIVPMLAATLEDEPEVKHEPSEAVVVAGDSPAPPTAAAPAAPGPVVEPPKSEPVPEDWLGRFCAALAAGGWCGGKAPADHKNARAKWLRSNGDEIARVASIYYGEQNPAEAKVERFISIPPGDYQRLALWLEQKNASRNPEQGTEVQRGTEAPSAVPVEEEPVQADEPPPTDEEVAVENGIVPSEPAAEPAAEPQAFDVETLVVGLDQLRFATKGARRFYERVEKDGSVRYAFVDGEVLTDLGYTKEYKGKIVPASIWLDSLSSDAAMALVARLSEEKRKLGL